MKKRVLVLSLSGALCLGGFLTACGENNGGHQTVEPEKFVLEFEKQEYVVNSGDRITVKKAKEGIKYAFQGGTPEGVTLNEVTGEVTFVPTNDKLNGTYRYIATLGEESAVTNVKFNIQEILPTVTITNVSNYLVSGEAVTATAVTDTGKEFALTYALKNPVDGITLDETTGVVQFGGTLANNTKFTVVATSGKVSVEKEFIAMTSGFVTTDTKMQITESGTKEVATFTLNYNGNIDADNETTAQNLKIAINDKIVEDTTAYSYDATTKVVSIDSKILNTLPSGEINVKVLTQRNAVKLNLIIADKFIYTGDDFNEIFAPDYSITETKTQPTFKEGSLSGYYVLGADIDLSAYLGTDGAGFNDDKGWKPIGTFMEGSYDIPFTGTFNGLGHTISGFKIAKAAPAHNGLFGNNNGIIKNFTLKGTAEAAGWSSALVGRNDANGVIENVIVDVPYTNGASGLAATGAICSVNFGAIRNCLSINANVQGFNKNYTEWAQSGLRDFAQSGVIVGLNEITGVIENTYGITCGGEKEPGVLFDGIFGSNNNAALDLNKVGKLFKTAEEMQAFDFTTALTDEVFNVTLNQLPATQSIYEPLSAGYMKFNNIPSFAFKTDEIDLDVNILPAKYDLELKDKVVYTFSGVEGVTFDDATDKLSFATATIPADGGKLTITATLEHGGKTLSDTHVMSVYDGLQGITMTPFEYFEAGQTYTLSATLQPAMASADITYEATWPAWKNNFITLNGDQLTIADNIPSYATTITLKATALGLSSAEISVPIKQLSTFAGNNQVHFKGQEANTFDYNLPAVFTNVTRVTVENKELAPEQFTFTAGKLSIDPTIMNANVEVQHEVNIYGEDATANVLRYRAYATTTADVVRDKAFLDNAFGAGAYITIETQQQFIDIFYNSDQTVLKANLARDKAYLLNCDIDLTGLDLGPIGAVFGDTEFDQFRGQLYGNNHTIKGFKSTTTTHPRNGLFAMINYAQIYDLNLDSFEVSGNNWAVGALCGAAGMDLTPIIKNVNVYNSIVLRGEATPENNAGTNVGGLFGKTWATGPTVQYCTYNGFNLNFRGQ